MLNDYSKFNEETIISTKEDVTRMNLKSFNRISMIFDRNYYINIIQEETMEELTYKDLSQRELDYLKDIYISSRVNSMKEEDLRLFVREIIIDQVKGTVGNAEEKEAWQEMKDHFSDDLNNKILEVKAKFSKNTKEELKSPEELEFDKRLTLLKQQKEENSTNDMWED